MLHIVDGAAEERAKYEEIWALPEYKNYSPGLENVERFMSVVHPRDGSDIIDFGCGTGAAMLEFDRRGFRAWGVDITTAALDPQVNRERFFECPLWDRFLIQHDSSWDYGFCCDVLEHIPPEYTMLCIAQMLHICRHSVWFQICNLPDNFGKRIGRPLHLTVCPYDWWLQRIASLGKVLDARDLCGNSLFVVTR